MNAYAIARVSLKTSVTMIGRSPVRVIERTNFFTRLVIGISSGCSARKSVKQMCDRLAVVATPKTTLPLRRKAERGDEDAAKAVRTRKFAPMRMAEKVFATTSSILANATEWIASMSTKRTALRVQRAVVRVRRAEERVRDHAPLPRNATQRIPFANSMLRATATRELNASSNTLPRRLPLLMLLRRPRPEAKARERKPSRDASQMALPTLRIFGRGGSKP